MLYTVEGRPSAAFFGGESNRFPIYDMALFGFSFEAEERLSDEAIRETVAEVQGGEDLIGRIWIDVEDVEISDGSVSIVIVVGACTAPAVGATAGGLAVGGLALWAADKVLGGALSEFGKKIAGKIWNKIPSFRRISSVFDMDAAADQRARDVAHSNGCKCSSLEGGLKDGDRYRYRYRLYGDGCQPRVVLVWVDVRERRTQYQVE